jgi:hypothetical protein
MSSPRELPRLDRSAFSVSSFQDAERDDRLYWANKTPEERLTALEEMRQIVYGYDPTATRLQRILVVARRPPG